MSGVHWQRDAKSPQICRAARRDARLARGWLVPLLLAAFLWVAPTFAADQAGATPPAGVAGDNAQASRELYLTSVKPLLTARCVACHGALQQKGGLRLDTAHAALTGGDSGPAIAPHDTSTSLLLLRVGGTTHGDQMPPAGEGEHLKPEEQALLARWIVAGAAGPADEVPEADPRQHWAYQPPRPVGPERSSVLSVSVSGGESSPEGPVDAFLDVARQQRGVAPLDQADRRLLLRRVTLDLIGLPPTEAEVAEFLADEHPLAYERVVDRLLADPRHGERWARHWMDIWRYSDAWGLGDDIRNSQQNLWHWRDWIIESLNRADGYDRLLQDMLAADELAPNDFDRLRATGFLTRNYFKFNRTTWLDGVIEHTSKAFLGVTLNCAKCHDHKYDPLSNDEYYQFRAVFEPYQVRTERIPGVSNPLQGGISRVFDSNLDAPTYRHIRGEDTRPDTSRPMTPGVPSIFGAIPFEITPVDLPLEATEPQLRPFVLAEELARAAQQWRDQQQRERDAEQHLEQVVAACTGRARPADSDGVLTALWPANSSMCLLDRPALEAAQRLLAAARHRTAHAATMMQVWEARGATEQLQAAARRDGPADDAALVTAIARTAGLERTAQLEQSLATLEEALAALAVWQPVFDSPEANTAAGQQRASLQKQAQETRDSLAQQRMANLVPGVTYTRLVGAVKTPESNVETPESQARPFPLKSTGRRTALARWLTSREHPLTARVAVNHVWTRHFGQSLTRSVFDFGRKLPAPEQQPLLDWLACEFMARDWDFKPLHRQLVTSRTYRLAPDAQSLHARDEQSSRREQVERNRAIDPGNEAYWRREPLRMESQVVRDSMLALAGLLRDDMGGPSIPSAGEERYRRSLYFAHSHTDRNLFLAMFDDADVQECYRRSDSVVPQQALALSNSQLSWQSATAIAQRLERLAMEPDQTASLNIAGGTDTSLTRQRERFIAIAFEHLLGTSASDAEVDACLQALDQWSQRGAGGPVEQVVRVRLVQALLNHNDFVTIR